MLNLSFCNTEDQKPAYSIQINHVVKHYLHLKKKNVLYFSNHKFKYLDAVMQGALNAFQTGINGKKIIREFYLSDEVD